MTTFLKVTICTTLTTGLVGGISFFSYWYFLPKNLSELLKKEGVKLLDVHGNRDDESWKKLVEKYKGVGQSITLKGGKLVNRVKNLEIASSNFKADKDFSKLKDECKKLFKKSIKRDAEFNTWKQNAKDWCSINSDVLKKELETAPVNSIHSIQTRN